MRSLKTKKFYKQLAEKYKVSEKTISDIDHSQFELLAELIRNSDKAVDKFYNYRIPYFGIFIVSKTLRQNLIKKYKKDGNITTE